ncbi:MAG: PAS domain S-box protein [Bacteroidales bacterium]|nr:PAS domain S-box protein [Bacteroidales bacterium]
MKIRSKITPKGRQINPDTLSYWQNKYLSLFEKFTSPVLEVEGNRILHYNKYAKQLFKLKDQRKKLYLNDLFDDCSKFKPGKTNIKVRTKEGRINFNIDIIELESPANFIIIVNYGQEIELNPKKAAQIKTGDFENDYYSHISEFCNKIKNGFFVTDTAGNFYTANIAFCNLTGYTLEELQKLNFFKITPENWLEYEKNIYEKTLKTRNACTYEKEIRHKSGFLVPVEIQVYPYFKEDLHAGYNFMVHNITNDKKMYNELIETRRLFDSSLKHSSSIILIYDSKGKVIYSNLDFFNIARVNNIKTPADILNQPIPFELYDANGALVSPDNFPLRSALTKGKITSNAEFEVKADNTRVWVSATASPIKDEKGEIIAAIMTITLIDDRKRTEIELKESKLIVESILDTTPARVFWKDRQLRFLGCNKMFLKDAGLSDINQIIGKTDHDMVWAKHAKQYQSDDKDIINTGNAKLGIEEPHTTPDGNIMWVRTYKIPLKNPDGEIIGILGSYYDITELRNTVLELHEHQNILEQLVKARTDEIAIINDQLNVKNAELEEKNLELLSSNKELKTQFEEKNKIEQQLIQSENILRGFIEESSQGICLINRKGKIIEWNDAMSEIFETDRKKYINKNIWELDIDTLPSGITNEAEKNIIKETSLDLLNNPRHLVVNDVEREINGKTKYINYRMFPIQSAKGIIIGRINIDVTDQKLAFIELEQYKTHLEQLVDKRTDELRQSEVQLRLLLQSVPMAFYSYQSENRNKTLWYSEQIKTLTGFEPSDFTKNPLLWLERINKDDYAVLHDSFNNISPNIPVTCEYRWKNKKNQYIWIYDQAVLIEKTENHPSMVIGCFMDITERREAENSVLESERNYREIFNSTSDAIFIHNVQTGTIEDVNSTMLAMFNTNYENVIANGFFQFTTDTPPFDMENALKQMEITLEKGFHQFEWLAKKATGERFWTHVSLRKIRLNNIDKVMAIVRDIDEQKKTEGQIKYRNDFEKLIYNISSRFINLPYEEVDASIDVALKEIGAFAKTDAAYIFIYNNEAHTISIKHLWQSESINFIIKSLIDVDFSFIKWHADIILSNNVVNVKSTYDLPEEAGILKEIVLQQNVHSFVDVPLIYQGTTIGFIGLAVKEPGRVWLNDEITLLRMIGQSFINAIKRKESVHALLDSEQTHREIYNATSEAMIVVDFETAKFLDVNNALLEMFNMTYEEAIEKDLFELISTCSSYSKKQIHTFITRAAEGKPLVFEWFANKKDGSGFWIENSLRSADIKGKKRLLSVLRDITDRKKAEEELKKSEEKYRLLVESQTDLVIKIDPDGRFLFVSPSYCELFSKTEQHFFGKKFITMVHEDDQKKTTALIKNLYSPPHTCFIEQRSYTKDGWRWIAWNDKALLDKNNKVKEIICVGRDITYQKGVEEALRRSEDRFRSIVQQLSDIVLIIDKETNILYDTPSVEHILGYHESFLVGKPGIELIHPEDKNVFLSKLNELIDNKTQIVTIELRMKHDNNNWIPLETVIINLLNHPSINGLIITMRDISERKLVEKRILDAVIKTEEQERERFAKDLHDDLGPLLSSLKMYINSINAFENPDKNEYIIQQLNEIIKESIATTKNVSNDLSPHILNNYGLVSATESFLKKVPSAIHVNLDTDLTIARFSSTVENSFYRIIKELINNTLKHANASEINIKLFESNQNLFLDYSDNGKGFDVKSLEEGKHHGMGLSNILSRAKSLNGKFEFKTGINQGFTFKLNIPISQTIA